MKRVFNVYDALFVLFLYFKLSLEGPAITWVVVFFPYVLEAVIIIATVCTKAFSIGDRIKFKFWQWAMSYRIRKAGKNAEQAMKAVQKNARPNANPGSFVDPSNLGK